MSCQVCKCDDDGCACPEHLAEIRRLEADVEIMKGGYANAAGERNSMLTQRDAYRAMICDLLASASPHPTEHPTMTKQWDRARKLLKDGP